ncbi:hypothetical protein [Aquisphaera giovannonii]|nr:hypothetical protein [Aquisphaera giovannonii]
MCGSAAWGALALMAMVPSQARGQATGLPAPPDAKAYSEPPKAAPFKVDSSTQTWTVKYCLGGIYPHGKFAVIGQGSATRKIAIGIDLPGQALPPSLAVSAKTSFGKNEVEIPIGPMVASWDPGAKAYVIDGRDLDVAADALVAAVNRLAAGFDSDTKVEVKSPVALLVAPRGLPGIQPEPLGADNPVTIAFQQVLPPGIGTMPSAQASPQSSPQGGAAAGPGEVRPGMAPPVEAVPLTEEGTTPLPSARSTVPPPDEGTAPLPSARSTVTPRPPTPNVPSPPEPAPR